MGTHEFIQIKPDPSRLSPFSREIFRYLKEDNESTADAYALCHQPGAGWVRYCPDCARSDRPVQARYIPRSCNLRICPKCAEKQAQRFRTRYGKMLDWVFDNCRPGWSVKLITLTTSISIDDFSPGFAGKLMHCAMLLAEELILCHDGAGVIVCIEVGEHGGKFHVHMIAYCPYIHQHTLSERWAKHSDGDYIVDIRRMWNTGATVSEGLKYITKFVNLSPWRLWMLHNALKGTRRVRSRGLFYMHPQNPLRDALERDCENGCECPECGSEMDVLPEQVFVHWIADQRRLLTTPHVYPDVADDEYARILNLTCGNKSGADPP